MSNISTIRLFIREFLVEVCGGKSEDVEDVIATANLAHLGQKRRSSGLPGISHPEKVAKIVKNFYADRDDLCLAAYLHDSLEDAPKLGNISEDDLVKLIMGSIQDHDQGQKILSIIKNMTHDKELQTYEEYFNSIINKPDTLIVKLSDMLHNLRDNPSNRQALKYKNVINSLNRNKINFISDEHWNALDNALATALKFETNNTNL